METQSSNHTCSAQLGKSNKGDKQIPRQLPEDIANYLSGLYSELFWEECHMSPGNVCGREVTAAAVIKCSEQKLVLTERRRELLSKQC